MSVSDVATYLGGGAAALAVLVATIGLFGALGGAATSYFIGQQSIYVNAITTERMKWIGSLKELVTIFITQAHYIINISNFAKNEDFGPKDAIEHVKEFYRLRSKIAFQINPFGKIDSNLLMIVDAVNVSMKLNNGRKELDNLEKVLRWHAQWLFKIEWEKVKREAMSPISKLVTTNKVKKLEREYLDCVNKDGGLPLVRRLVNK